jgi:hypothetical protein
MGLDNMPKVYPCKPKASLVDGKIDCDATKACGNCTWENEAIKNPTVTLSGRTYGMFGADCWYRGKWGNGLLSALNGTFDVWGAESSGYTFYGNGHPDGSEGISPDECYEMANFMEKSTEDFIHSIKQQYPDQVKEYNDDWNYAIWWLRFVAEFADGSATWY